MTTVRPEVDLPPRRYGLDKLAAELKRLVKDKPGTGLRDRLEALAEDTPDMFDAWWARSKTAYDGPIDVIDFFSGCGGMSAGFRALNGITPIFKNVLAVDVDQKANATYERNLRVQPQRVDIRELTRTEGALADLLRSSARRDGAPLFLIGCAPCQGFSSYRNKAGAADDRNSLFDNFAELAVRLAPDFIVLENVPELCTDKYWPFVERAKTAFHGAGYSTHLAIHNFAHFGLPQERFRAVMIAGRTPFNAPQGFLERTRFRTVREAIQHLPPLAAGQRNPDDPMHVSASHRESTLQMIRSVPKDGGKRAFNTGPASLQDLSRRQGRPAYEDIYGRLFWDKPAITITHYSRNPASGRFVHPDQDRGLSGREASLLQGFPIDYEFMGGFDDKFSQIGNAVPPRVAAHLSLSLLAQLLEPPTEASSEGISHPVGQSYTRLIAGRKRTTLGLPRSQTNINEPGAK